MRTACIRRKGRHGSVIPPTGILSPVASPCHAPHTGPTITMTAAGVLWLSMRVVRALGWCHQLPPVQSSSAAAGAQAVEWPRWNPVSDSHRQPTLVILPSVVCMLAPIPSSSAPHRTTATTSITVRCVCFPLPPPLAAAGMSHLYSPESCSSGSAWTGPACMPRSQIAWWVMCHQRAARPHQRPSHLVAPGGGDRRQQVDDTLGCAPATCGHLARLLAKCVYESTSAWYPR